MSPNSSTSIHIESKHTYTQKKVTVPPADSQPAITVLAAGKKQSVERMVKAGVDLANAWLENSNGLRLDEEIERARKLVGEIRWPIVEKGFAARIHQRFAALSGSGQASEPAGQPGMLLAIGNEAMKLMHEQLAAASGLARSGDIKAFSQAGRDVLETMEVLAVTFTITGPVRRTET